MTSLANAVAVWMLSAPAAAQPETVGLFVGSNRPGPGQQPLQFAVQDAERFREVMQEIGGVTAASTLLMDPDADDVLAALQTHATGLEARADAGAQTVFVFYYSGHARSQALTLGPSELSLQRLRQQLEAMPSTVTVAVLDACQSGAISSVKGVEPATDFSYNSTHTLRSQGLAVMASSTGSELSQESDAIGGSFFTHHLVAGLRGPADTDDNGAVSLDEAYRYAYHRTLVTTTPTQVGGQHVTLETQLRGQGDMVLTRPSEANAWLLLDGPSGRVLVVRADTGVVVAELVREGTDAMSLALTNGRYQVIGRDDTGGYRCDVRLIAGERVALSTADCVPHEGDVPGTVKSGAGPFRADSLSVEVAGGGLLSPSGGAYRDRLTQFGYTDTDAGPFGSQLSLNGSIALTGRIAGHWSWVATAGLLERERWAQGSRQQDSFGATTLSRVFNWRSWRLGAYLRHSARLGRGDAWRWMAQAGGGPVFTTSWWDWPGTPARSTSWHAAGAAGLHWMAPGSGIRVGGFGQLDGVWAPALRNSTNDTRNVGGAAATAGVRVAL
ncbi:MAG: caspase family protein [Myxococcales bacterium]|nr:caspase family protein [Myxococcales bacterium]